MDRDVTLSRNVRFPSVANSSNSRIGEIKIGWRRRWYFERGWKTSVFCRRGRVHFLRNLLRPISSPNVLVPRIWPRIIAHDDEKLQRSTVNETRRPLSPVWRAPTKIWKGEPGKFVEAGDECRAALSPPLPSPVYRGRSDARTRWMPVFLRGVLRGGKRRGWKK